MLIDSRQKAKSNCRLNVILFQFSIRSSSIRLFRHPQEIWQYTRGFMADIREPTALRRLSGWWASLAIWRIAMDRSQCEYMPCPSLPCRRTRSWLITEAQSRRRSTSLYFRSDAGRASVKIGFQSVTWEQCDVIGDVTAGCRTHDRDVVGATSGLVGIK